MENYPVTHNNGAIDRRYTITQEYCGHDGPRYVARFCGEWIGQTMSYSGAVLKAIGHKCAALNGIITEVRT